MPLPFVRRADYDRARAAHERARVSIRELRTQIREAHERALVAEAQSAVLREHLQKSEAERTEVTLKLVKVSFGVNPFEEQQPLQPVTAPEPDKPAVTGPPANATREQVQEWFVREGAAKYGNSFPRIREHVQRRMDAYYSGGFMASVVSPAEMEAAQRVQQELQDSIREGQEAALRKKE